MSSEADAPCSLREMELEVEAEGREWMRRRLEEKLQARAHRQGEAFPQSGWEISDHRRI
jgi:hypothetical protein